MAEWASFYVIVGSSGAALIRIQFVAVTLIANMRERPPAETVHAFGTPTVVHLAGALLVSAIMSAEALRSRTVLSSSGDRRKG